MSKSRNRTTGLPPSSRRTAEGRRQRSRSEREAQANRIVLIVSAALAGLIVLIIGVAVLIENVIQPNQAVAVVAGQNITSHDFQRRVVFERYNRGRQLGSIIQQFGQEFAGQFLGNPQSPYGQMYQQLQIPSLLGQAVLDEMINGKLIQMYANANNISLNDSEIDKQLGYDPNPPTATLTTTPSTTPSPFVSPTPTTTPTPTLAPTHTPTLTVTPLPTGIPTVTPGATEARQQFDKNIKNYYDLVGKQTGFNEAEIRQYFAEQALREKVRKALFGEPLEKQEQSKVRHILVTTEAQAKDVMAALQAGESFASLAKAVSMDDGNQDQQPGGGSGSAAQGGDLGWKGRGAYVTEFEDAVWSDKTKVGDVLGPIKTQFGYHIIQVTGRETRTLTESEKSEAQDKQFADWVKKQRDEKGVQIFDLWRDRTPDSPTLTELGLPANLGGGMGGFPGGFPQ
jgi:hypothetical protein